MPLNMVEYLKLGHKNQMHEAANTTLDLYVLTQDNQNF